MGIREVARSRWGGRLSRAMGELNGRHPWSHNDHFHAWILNRLPKRRHRALDIGCGRGELLALLADHVDRVHGIDIDAGMRHAATMRCTGLENVTVGTTTPAELAGSFDVVTMVAVLHHLDVEQALDDAKRLLAPGGRFLCVGLARPDSLTDQIWDVASIVTNPVIGFVKHPWPSLEGPQPPRFPVTDPRLTFQEIRVLAERAMPGIQLRRHLGFRHTMEWTHP